MAAKTYEAAARQQMEFAQKPGIGRGSAETMVAVGAGSVFALLAIAQAVGDVAVEIKKLRKGEKL